jgi:hypothetical protein
MGELHEAGLEIALMAGDESAAKQHFIEMERWYLSTGAPSLAQRCEALAKSVASPAERPLPGRAGDASSEPHTHGNSLTRRMHTVDRMLAGGSMSVGDRAHKALQILAEKCRCTDGFLYLFDGRAQLAEFASLKDESLHPVVAQWLKERVVGEADEDVTQLIELKEGEGFDLLEHEGRHYRLLVLTPRTDAQTPVGAALLASDAAYPAACPPEVLRSVAHHMGRALRQGDSASLV